MQSDETPEKQGKRLLVCRDCGKRETVTDEGNASENTCPDCAGILLPADEVKMTTFEAEKEAGDPLEGLVVGGCRLERKLGAGGMGYVYKARHLALNKSVAIKFLSEHISNEHAKKRFLKEARTAARLEHANIVTVHDTGIDKGKHYIVMQFIEGESMADRIKRDGPIPVMQALDIVIEAARGIAAAHHMNMIHRDIKPDNVMIDKNGAVKVADFGLAKDLTDGSGITLSQQAMGTPHYMSPEQANDARSADQRADVYSLGATLYATLAGTPPFTGSTPWAIISQHQSEPLPDIRQKVADVPAPLALALEKMLEKDPANRFQTMDDVIEELLERKRELREVHDFDSAPTIMPGPPPAVAAVDVRTPATYIPPEPPKSRVVPILGVVAVVAVAGLVVAVLALSGVLGPTDKGGSGSGSLPVKADENDTKEPETKKIDVPEKPPGPDLAAKAAGVYIPLRARAFSLAGRDEYDPALAALCEFPEEYRGTPTWVRMEKDRAEILGLAVARLRHELGAIGRPSDTGGAKTAKDRVKKIADFLRAHEAEAGGEFDVEGFETLVKETAERLRHLEGYLAEMDWIATTDREAPTLPDEDIELALKRLQRDAEGKVPGTEVYAAEVLEAVKNILEERKTEKATRSAEEERESFTRKKAQARALADRGDHDGASKLLEAFLGSPVEPVRDETEKLRQQWEKAKAHAEKMVEYMAEIDKLLATSTWKGLGHAEQAYSTLTGEDPPPFLANQITALGGRIERAKRALQERFAKEGLRVLPGGSFRVGSPEEEAENPERDVVLKPVLMGEREVTNGEYAKFVSEDNREAPLHWGGSSPPAELLPHPVTHVSAGDAEAYCAWLSAKTGKKYRLPKAAEWEVAAAFADGKMRRYPWGDTFESGKANLAGGKTVPAGSHDGDRSPCGALDLAGNVCEWTTRSDDPSGRRFVVFGGCCDDKSRERAARCAFRQVFPSGMRSPFLGFRVARELE